VIPNIRRVYPALNILIFSMQPAEIYGEALKQYGINYYMSKSVGEEEMIQILYKFMHNEMPVHRKAISTTTTTRLKHWPQENWRYCIMY
jgi:DNA-binding NarL/FixJ family response regulator